MGGNSNISSEVQKKVDAYFVFQETDKQRKRRFSCKLCGEEWGATTIDRRIKHFVPEVPGGLAKCRKVQDVDEEDSMLFKRELGVGRTSGHNARTESASTSRQPLISEAITFQSEQEFSSDFAIMVADCGLPFNHGRNPTVRRLWEKHAERRPPDDKTVKKRLDDVSKKMQGEIEKMVKAAWDEGTLAALLTDSWTSNTSKRPYVNYILFVPNHGFAYLGSTDAHGYRQTSENLVYWGLGWLEHYNLSLDNISCVLADGAAKCTRAAKEMKDGASHLQTVTCVAHSIDNCIKSVAEQEDLQKAWRKIDAVVDFVISNQRILAQLRQIANDRSYNGELKKPGNTRFASHCIEVERFLEMSNMIESALRSTDVMAWADETITGSKRRLSDVPASALSRERRGNANNTAGELEDVELEGITDGEDSDDEDPHGVGLGPLEATDCRAVKKQMTKAEKWRWCIEVVSNRRLMTSASDLISITKPMVELLREVDSGQAFMGKIFHRMFQVQEKLEKLQSGRGDSNVPRDLVQKAIAIWRQSWEKLHCPAMTVGYALDPEFIDANQEDMPEFHSDWNAVATDILGTVEKAEAAKQAWMSEFKQLKTGQLAPGSQGEKNAKAMAGHQYWKLYLKQSLPDLAKLAVQVLAMPVAASPCEGIWSVFQYMQRDKRRAAMHSDNLRLQVFVNANGKLFRRKKAGLWKSQTTGWTEEDEHGEELGEESGGSGGEGGH